MQVILLAGQRCWARLGAGLPSTLGIPQRCWAVHQLPQVARQMCLLPAAANHAGLLLVPACRPAGLRRMSRWAAEAEAVLRLLLHRLRLINAGVCTVRLLPARVLLSLPRRRAAGWWCPRLRLGGLAAAARLPRPRRGGRVPLRLLSVLALLCGVARLALLVLQRGCLLPHASLATLRSHRSASFNR